MPDAQFNAFRIALHEGGHALGLSNINHPLDAQTYSDSHPTIPDSVMNYDGEVSQISDEPDCSPHPFDVMAIYAIYQNVGR